MNRRKFFKRASAASLGPLLLNGLPVRTLAGHHELQALTADADHDRVLVLIQLHGGNDGLNTLVPLNRYDQYYNLRSNLALPSRGSRRYLTLDSQLADGQQLGVHPDMQSFQRLYDNGRSAVVQSVAYDNFSTSHFRSRDIWLMGGGGNDNFDSGWAGRYLSALHPDYPQAYPSKAAPDPLAIEIGSQVSLAFHREDGISTAVAVNNPEQFLRLASQVQSKPTSPGGNSYYDEEISYIAGANQQANQYAQRINDVFAQGKNSSTPYPTEYPQGGARARNELSNQLKTIARLINGGSQTRVFLARIGGFDTHVQQVQYNDPTRGVHAALLYNLFGAIEAFQNDLKRLGLEDRVMTVTFSEFGRRVASNASRGTDHGTAAPLFVFGKHVNPGVVGTNADLSDLDRGNLKYQYDYRQVLGTLLKDWMRADASAMNQTRFAAFAEETLPLVGGKPVSPPVTQPKKPKLADGVYKMRSVATGQIVEVAVANGDADNVRVAANHDGLNQRWQFTKINNVYYRITSLQNLKMCLDARKWGTVSGTNVQVWTCRPAGQNNQEWHLVADQDGHYRLIPRYVEEESLGLSLSVAPSGSSGEVNLQLSTRRDVSEQRFTLERVAENARVASGPDKQPPTAPSAFASTVTAYPNPFVDKVYLSGLAKGTALVQVRDALGKVVLHQPVKEDRSPLELGSLVKGIYYVSVEQADKKTVQKLIKE